MKGMAMEKLGCALAVFFCGLLVAGPAAAMAKVGPGEVDPRFGQGGLVVHPGSQLGDTGSDDGPYGEDMAVGPEDAVFVLQGYRACGVGSCTAKFFVQRYLPNGVLDMSFGEGGRSSMVAVTVAAGSESFYGVSLYGSLAVNGEGEPVIAAVDGGDITLFRLDRSGKLAADFGGGDGTVTTDFGSSVVRPRLAVARDGRIVVATGFSRREDARFVILARYEQNGDLDPSFGAGTPEAASAGWMAIGGAQPGALALSPGGGILLAGGRCCPPRDSVYLGRRGSDGRPIFPDAPASPWRYLKVGAHATVTSVVALPRGKAYLVGNSRQKVFAAKTLASGRLDRTFGRAGVVRLKGIYAGASPALADRSGRLYIAGFRGSEEYVANRALLARVTRKGRLDRRWGDDPAGYSLLPSSFSEVQALGFQSSGKVVAFGHILGECIRSCPLPSRVLTRLLVGSAPRQKRR
jgi:uncharacterized delta-60 repeat protein